MNLQDQAAVIVDEILEEFETPSDPEAYERLARETVEAPSFNGPAELARAVAAELRRRALVIRNR